MTGRPLHSTLTGLCMAAAMLTAGAGYAADNSTDKNPVVAKVDGEAIHFEEVMTAAERLPARYKQRMKQLFPRFVDRIVEMRVAAAKAEEGGLLETEKVQKRLERARRKILSDVYLKQQAESFVTEEKLKAEYKKYKKNNKPEPQVHARHILVDSKKLANKLISQLDEGAEFVKLAKKKSSGPSAKKGGDLGFFAKGDMVDPFSKAAFNLDVGEYTSSPVKTQYGWHVIKVVDKRTKQPKSFKEMKPKLTKKLRRRAVQATLKDLKKEANVKTWPERGTKLLGGNTGMTGGSESGGSGS